MASQTETEAQVHGRLTPSERAQRGKEARSRSPRSSHATFDPGAGRTDPLELLERQAKTRVPELVPIRYGRMLVSPFAFFRGAAMVMAHDLASTPRSGLITQCCGDAHLSNFGLFASPERRMVFDLNDFDETLPGPWEWDVKRLAASVVIAARDNGLSAAEQEQIVLSTVREYRTTMRSFAAMGSLEVWYAHLEVESILQELGHELDARALKLTKKVVAKAHTRDSMSAFSKLTRVVDGRPRIADQSPLIVPADALVPPDQYEAMFATLRELYEAYLKSLEFHRRVLLEEFELMDFARKVVGVGSVGTRAWIALLYGRDGEDPLFLQVKEAETSVLEEPLGPSQFDNHAERVVFGQRLMQASSDIFLGWVRVVSPVDGEQRDFYGRQLRDWKGSVEIDELAAPGMAFYARLCGRALARAHARSGDRIAIAAYLGGGSNFERALLEFSMAYADQNELDYQSLRDAVSSGRIQAQTGL